VVAEDRSGDAAEVDRRLADDGLPSTAELGKIQLTRTWNWWRLHRRKRKVQQRIGRAGDR